MPSPFPGMDPWLEHPALWPDVHHGLIEGLRLGLAPALRPRYYLAVGLHTYILAQPGEPSRVRIPDVMVVDRPQAGAGPVRSTASAAVAAPIEVSVPVPEEIEESYLEVREVAGDRVITVIEILSPTNKRPGAGRQKYEDKRMEILGTLTHLVEIDLLRNWDPMPFYGNGRRSHYRILVRRGERRERAGLYAFNLRDPIPGFPLPLQKGDVEPTVDLKSLLDELYDKASYDLRIDYFQPPEPPLDSAEAEWAGELLQTSLHRNSP